MRRGQHQWWLLNRQYNIQKGGFDKNDIVLLKWSFVQGLSEDIGADREEEEWTARRTAGGASSNTFFLEEEIT